MSAEENLNAARPVQVGAHSPESGVSDEAVEAAAKTMSVLWESYTASMRTALEAALPHLQPQPVASRSAVAAVLEAHKMRLAHGTAEMCACGWVPPDVWAWHADHREHLADAVLNLLNGTGVDSTVNTCPGCGVKVIGHERCGDPTRPGCAS